MKAKILVVDNDKDMCWLIASILREEGYSVDNAYDGESALLKINHHHYEVLVLDYKLSGLSGLSILEKARQTNPSNETIMISAFGNELVRAKAKELGAYAFLDKPFNINGLKKTVKKALTEQVLSQNKLKSKSAKEPKGSGENLSPGFWGNSDPCRFDSLLRMQNESAGGGSTIGAEPLWGASQRRATKEVCQ